MDKKSLQLGEHHSTAEHRLRKRFMFSLAVMLNLHICFRCKQEIDSADEASIDHKIPWLDNSNEMFWDLSNVALSHKVCNSRAARRPHKKECPEGTRWCSKCKACCSKHKRNLDVRQQQTTDLGSQE